MSITSRINEMSSHIEQAYDELQGLGADLTNVNKNIENISMVLDDIYDSMPQVSGEGTSLTLDDTRVGKIKSTLKGNISQSGTPTPSSPIPVNVVSGDNEINVCGKNLWYDIPDRYSHQGVTLTKADDGGYVLNGTTTGVAIFNFNLPVPIEQGTYVLSINASANISNNVFLRARDSNMAMVTPQSQVQGNNTTSNSSSFTCTTDIYTLALNLTTSGVTYNNLKIYPMIEKGSSASTYEPYQGNTYNIDLPVENLLQLTNDKETFNYQNTHTIEDNVYVGIPTANWAQTRYKFYLEKNTQYTFSSKLTFEGSNFPSQWQVTIKNDDDTNIFSGLVNIIDNKISVSFNSGDNEYNEISFWSRTNDSSRDITKTTYSEIQLEKGSKANTYTPYGTTPIELCKIGNYQDYFYKDSGKWYLHKEIGKVVLDGTQTITINSSSASRTVFEVNNITNLKDYATLEEQGDSPNILCSKFNQVSQNASWASGDISKKRLNQNKVFIIWEANKTIAELETLTTNMPIYYVLATPTNTEVEYQPLIDQLNLLEKAMSKDGQTNISQVNNDLPFIISASALKEWQESTSLNSTLSMVNPLSLGNTLNTQENDIQPIEVDNIEPLEEEENEES